HRGPGLWKIRRCCDRQIRGSLSQARCQRWTGPRNLSGRWRRRGRLPTRCWNSDYSARDGSQPVLRPRRVGTTTSRRTQLPAAQVASLFFVSFCESKRDDGVAFAADRVFDFADQRGFEVVGIRNHFARRDLFFVRSVVTEFANPEAAFGFYRRSEHAAGDRTSFIEIACSSRWIER